MLVLTRCERESIVITPTTKCRIVVSVLDVHGDKVRLGITAPHSAGVHREEIQLRIDKKNKNEKGVTNGVKPDMSSQAH